MPEQPLPAAADAPAHAETALPPYSLPPPPAPAPSGYRVERLLGQGGMGVVLLAFDQKLGRPVAIKRVRRECLAGASEALFEREARALARFSHPHIVQVHAWSEDDEGPFLVMEYVPGGTLEERLGASRPSPDESARLVAVLARAVAAAHAEGVVHRDLKPANVLMAPPVEGGGNVLGGCPKVADFGLARLAGHDGGTAPGIVGTPGYMAPEQAAGRADQVGPATDVWALGVILYRCLAGRLPFEGDSVLQTLDRIKTEPPAPPRDLAADVPAELEAICLACLEKDPARRPGAAELARRLDEVRLTPATSSAPAPTAQVRRGSAWRWAWVALPLAAVPLALLAWLASRPKPAAQGPLPGPLTAGWEVKPFGSARRLGTDAFAVRLGEGVRFKVALSRPAHAYLIAFSPDGKESLLWPAEGKDDVAAPAVAPPRVEALVYPSDRGNAYEFDASDPPGFYVFALVASERPLPSYEQWKERRGPVAWGKHLGAGVVWVASGDGVFRLTDGPLVRPGVRKQAAPPLAELREALLRGDAELVELFAFGVLPKE